MKKNCRECGKEFDLDESLSLTCPSCKQDEDLFKFIRNYLYDNPGSNIYDISDGTGIPHSKILKFVNDGRLIVKDEYIRNSNEDDDDSYSNEKFINMSTCNTCGKSIKTGVICESCVRSIRKESSSYVNTNRGGVGFHSRKK